MNICKRSSYKAVYCFFGNHEGKIIYLVVNGGSERPGPGGGGSNAVIETEENVEM